MWETAAKDRSVVIQADGFLCVPAHEARTAPASRVSASRRLIEVIRHNYGSQVDQGKRRSTCEPYIQDFVAPPEHHDSPARLPTVVGRVDYRPSPTIRIPRRNLAHLPEELDLWE